MANAKPGMSAAPAGYDERSAIGEVTVLVFGLAPGQTEVRVRYPKDALPGASGARANRDRFHSLVTDELKKSLQIFHEHGG